MEGVITDKPRNSIGLQTLFLAGSRMFERAAYYGFRAIILIHIIRTLGLYDGDALYYYGYATMAVYIAQLLGGLLGDFLIGNRNALILGGVMQLEGFYIVGFSGEEGLIMGVALIIIGSGLYTPNLLAKYGHLYLKKPAQMDSGFSILYVAVNLGALIGVFFMSWLADTEFRHGMILGCVFSLLSLVLLCFYKSEKVPKFNTQKVNSIEIRTLLIIAALLLSTLFWMAFEWGAIDIMKIYKTIDQTHAVKGIEMSSYYSQFNGIFCIILGVILAFAWFTIKINPWLKLAMGFGLAVIGYGLMFFISGEEQFAYNITLVSIALMALAELLISPIVLSIFTVNSHPKYLATVFGLVFLFTNIFTRLLTIYLPNDKLRGWIGISGVPLGVLVFLGLAIFTVLGWLIFRNEKPNFEETEL